MTGLQWTLLGWVLLIVGIVWLIAIPIGLVLTARARSRAIARIDQRRREVVETWRGRRLP